MARFLQREGLFKCHIITLKQLSQWKLQLTNTLLLSTVDDLLLRIQKDLFFSFHLLEDKFGLGSISYKISHEPLSSREENIQWKKQQQQLMSLVLKTIIATAEEPVEHHKLVRAATLRNIS